MSRTLLALALVASAFAGCISAPSEVQVSGEALATAAAEVPLWNNPQTAPHPAFGYPTLTNPATAAGVPEWWTPIEAKALPEHISSLEFVAQAGAEAGLVQGAGMALFGRLAVVPGYGEGTHVLDITDPAEPVVLSTIEDAEGPHRNVDFIAYPSGRLVGVFATGADFLDVYDLTDPANPVALPRIEPKTGTHKVNIVPGTPIVYNANSNGGGCVGPQVNGLLCFVAQQPRTPEQGTGITEIYDLTDPANPVLVQEFANGFGCHHIYFWNSAEKQRALCAGIEFTQIWDTSDPRNPEVIVNVPFQHGNPDLPSTTLGLYGFSHFAILNYAGDILIVGDESGGGGFPPGCDAGQDVGGKHVSGPLGNVWFYDVSDETSPELLGWFSPTVPVTENPPDPASGPGAAFYSCTAHHGRLVPDPEGREMLAMAFYQAGVYLVDFSDPTNPVEVDHYNDGSNTWEVQYYNGYLFTGDLARGMDVLTFG